MNEIFNLIADINYTGPNIYRRMNDDKERFDNNNTNKSTVLRLINVGSFSPKKNQKLAIDIVDHLKGKLDDLSDNDSNLADTISKEILEGGDYPNLGLGVNYNNFYAKGDNLLSEDRSGVLGYQKEFGNREKELKNEAANLLKQRSTLSKEAYKQKVDELREKVNKYQAQRKEILGKLTTQRAEARNKLIEKVNPIMEKYVNENKISLVLEKNVVLIGSTDSDITKIIVDRLNDELPSLSLK